MPEHHLCKQRSTGKLTWRDGIERALILTHHDLGKGHTADVVGHTCRPLSLALDNVIARHVECGQLGVIELSDAVRVIQGMVFALCDKTEPKSDKAGKEHQRKRALTYRLAIDA